MNTNNKNSINLISIGVIILFTIISCFGCFEIRRLYMVDFADEFYMAGDISIEDTRTNRILIIAILSILQIFFICMRKKGFSIASVVCSVFGLLVTSLYKPICDLSEQTYGGLSTLYCHITWIGYIAILLSVLNCLFQIISLVKRKS